jgi:hypothetical protein
MCLTITDKIFARKLAPAPATSSPVLDAERLDGRQEPLDLNNTTEPTKLDKKEEPVKSNKNEDLSKSVKKDDASNPGKKGKLTKPMKNEPSKSIEVVIAEAKEKVTLLSNPPSAPTPKSTKEFTWTVKEMADCFTHWWTSQAMDAAEAVPDDQFAAFNERLQTAWAENFVDFSSRLRKAKRRNWTIKEIEQCFLEWREWHNVKRVQAAFKSGKVSTVVGDTVKLEGVNPGDFRSFKRYLLEAKRAIRLPGQSEASASGTALVAAMMTKDDGTIREIA